MDSHNSTAGQATGASQFDGVNFTEKESVRKLNLNLESIVRVSEAVFPYIVAAKDQELILACGNTGCGKSTLITSLVFGTDKLEEVKIPEVRKLANGREKTFYTKYIDQKPDLKEFLTTNNLIGLFEIGHSRAESKTFIPHFFKPQDQNFTYSDIAGLMDTSGDLIDYVNCFMNKKIFNQSKKVKFIVPMSRAQLEENRGGLIVQQIEIILNICSQSYTDVIKSVQPVMTKFELNPSDEDVNEDDDIDVVKGRLKEIFDNYVRNYRKEREEELNQRSNPYDDPQDQEEGGIEDREKLQAEIADLDSFLTDFAGKVVIYDPLDRQIPTDAQMEANCIEEVWTTPRAELLQKLADLHGTQGVYLNVPLSNKLHNQLTKLLDKSRDLCLEEATNYTTQAKELGTSFNKQIQDNEQIVAYRYQLQFFAKHNLVEGIQKRLTKFDQQIQTYTEIIEKEKVYSTRGELDRLTVQQFKFMIEMKEARNFVALVKYMAQSQDTIDDIEKRQSSEFNVQIQTLKNDLQNMMANIYSDPREMAQFAFELRVYDAEQAIKNNRPEYYTKKFLDYNVFESPIWKAILTSNQWTKTPGDEEFRMIVDPKCLFKMSLGKYVLRCQDADFPEKTNCKESPFVVNVPDPSVIKDVEKSEGFWGKMKSFWNAENRTQFALTWYQTWTKNFEKGTDTFQFILSKQGLNIGKFFVSNVQAPDCDEFMIKETRLICNSNQVNPGSYQVIKLTDNQHRLWSDPRCTIFSLQPIEDSLDKFHIEMCYGDIPPRLISFDKDIRLTSTIIATMRNSYGHNNDEQSVWTITLA